MFPQRLCTAPNCGRLAFMDTEYCLPHLNNPAAGNSEAISLLTGSERIVNVNLAQVELANLDLSGKLMICCCFSYSSLEHVNFDGLRAETVFFDFCTLKNCSFRNSDLKFAVFAGSTIEDCDFSHSNILNCNFGGARCRKCEFKESDLYATRFIATELEQAGITDCNLKRVTFSRARLGEVNFRYSNVEDALFDGGIPEA